MVVSAGNLVSRLPRPSLPFMLLAGFLGILWVAGGASRADTLGQVVVRGVAWSALAVLAVFAARPRFHDARPVLYFLLAALAAILAQLVPLPPAAWQALPGRTLLTQAAVVAGEAQPWRPIAIVPDAAVNAASSLIVPFVILILTTGLTDRERGWLPGILLTVVTASALLALLQLAGFSLNNPLINASQGQASGSFANRNHLAVFLAVGCALAPSWAFMGRRPGLRAVVALGLVLLFALVILATGSRAGTLIGAVAIGLGLVHVGGGIARSLGAAPRWYGPAIVAATVAVILLFVWASIVSGRALSIDRVMADSQVSDMRTRGLPTVLAMVSAYFPVGSGFGGFDPIFRIHEPFELLKPTFFNHAHNDFLEVALDGGLVGIALLLAAILWWAVSTVRAWRGGSALARLGGTLIGLVLVASAFDYPARTPMMMAVLVTAALWLSGGRPRSQRAALRGNGQ